MLTRLRRILLIVFFGVFVLTLAPAQSDAQPSSQQTTDTGGFHGWQIDGHIGVIPSSTPSGTGTLPPPGGNFTTFTGVPSRFVPSWYFGDGALLANQVEQAISRNNGGIQLPQIVPLDPVLTTASAARQSGLDFGFRIGHSITRHVLVEFSGDVGQGKVNLTSQTLAAIEATRASFKPYFDTIIGMVNGNAVALTTTSTATVANNNTGSQIAGVVDVAISPGSYAGFTPYLTVGGGVLVSPGDAPTVTLVGTYAFTVNLPGTAINGARLSESDSVQVNYKVDAIRPVAVVGGGVQHNVTAHTGFRADVRFYPKGNNMTVRLDTNPVSGAGVPPGRINRGPGPGLQFSSLPSLPSNLSPPAAVRHFDTFTGHATEGSLTVGYYVQF